MKNADEEKAKFDRGFAETVASFDAPAARPQEVVDETYGDRSPAHDADNHEPLPLAGQTVEPLPLITPSAWGDGAAPERRWIVKDRIPAGDVTLLLGDGGTGKTTIALQLAAAMVRQESDWLGAVIEPGDVMLYSAEEDEDEVNRRLALIAASKAFARGNLSPGLQCHFPRPDDCLLGVPTKYDRIAPSLNFLRLRKNIETVRPALLIIDSVAATFGGNQVSRTHARSFISLFRSLGREFGTTVLLLDHPSVRGMNSGDGTSGNNDWHNASRSRLYFSYVKSSKTDDDEGDSGDLRELKTKKANYGPNGGLTKVRWRRGIFVVDGSASSFEQAAAEQHVDDVFLRILDKLTAQGREVSPAKSREGAALIFSQHPDRGGISKQAFARAQERLLDRGMLRIATDGPPSRRRKFLVRAA